MAAGAAQPIMRSAAARHKSAFFIMYLQKFMHTTLYYNPVTGSNGKLPAFLSKNARISAIIPPVMQKHWAGSE